MSGNQNSGRKREYLRIKDFEPFRDEVHTFLTNHWPTHEKESASMRKDIGFTKKLAWVLLGAALIIPTAFFVCIVQVLK